MSRINCHSAFKHYEMFHSGHCGGGYSNVSNTVFNINCGGHGGFWNGFGLGLGNALGGFFGGFGGGMGFGFPAFGNFGGCWGNWGNWGHRNPEKTDRATERTTETETVKEVIKDDPDCVKIADITGDIKDLGENPTKEELNKIIDNIDNAIKYLDDNNKTAQTRTLENLKKELLNKLNNLGSEELQDDETDDSAQDVNIIIINGKEIDLKNITLDDLKTAKPDELDKITKDQAILILKYLGYIVGDGDDAVGKLSNVYGVLKLLEKSGVTVEVENRSASADQWIKGPLSNVQQSADGKLSYNVDCKDIGAFGAKYLFQAQDKDNKKYKVSSADTTVAVDNTIEVEYQGEKQPLINNSGRVLVKQA